MCVGKGGVYCCGCAWTYGFVRDGDGDVLPLRSDCPPLWSKEGADPTLGSICSGGTRRTERTNKPSTGEASPTHLRTMCARFFKTANRARAKHKPLNRRPTKRAPPLPQSICRTTPRSRCSNPRAQSKIHVSASDQLPSTTFGNEATKQVLQSDAQLRVGFKIHITASDHLHLSWYCCKATLPIRRATRVHGKIHITASGQTRISTGAHRALGKLFLTDAAVHV